MADETKAAGTANGTPAAGTNVPKMRLMGQYLKDLSFESPNTPGVLQGQREKPEMKIDMTTRNRKVDQGWEVELTMKATCDFGNTNGYVVEVTYAAVAAFEEEATDQVRAVMLNVEVPQILFPFVRSLMCDLTAQGSFPPLMMQPIDFRSAFIQRVQQEAAKAKKQ